MHAAYIPIMDGAVILVIITWWENKSSESYSTQSFLTKEPKSDKVLKHVNYKLHFILKKYWDILNGSITI